MLQVRGLEKIIEHRTGLSIEQLDVAAGKVLGVIGLVGSGKTILIRLLSGSVMPSGGSVVFDGQDVHHTPALRARMGLLFEEDLLYERLSSQSNLETYCHLHGLPGSRAREALALVGLGDQMKTSANKLQSAAQRRLAFARAARTGEPTGRARLLQGAPRLSGEPPAHQSRHSVHPQQLYAATR